MQLCQSVIEIKAVEDWWYAKVNPNQTNLKYSLKINTLSRIVNAINEVMFII